MTDLDAGMDDIVHLPWATQPSGQGANECGWCGRAIYVPAMPCSIQPVEGLLRMKTMPGQGQRCQYELSTRAPEVIDRAAHEVLIE